MIRIRLTKDEQDFYMFIDKMICFYDIEPYKRENEPQRECYARLETVNGDINVDQNANQVQSRINEALKKEGK